MKIIERIFFIMEQKNLKQTDLADYLGLNTSVISTWKKRKTDPSSEYIYRICEFLNVSCEFILTGQDKRMNNLKIDDIKFIEKFDKLNERNKGKVEGYIEAILSSQENENLQYEKSKKFFQRS